MTNQSSSATTSTNSYTPPTDPGATLDEALDLGLFSGDGTITITDGVGSSDPADAYQFSIDQDNNFSFILDGLSADADLYVFDGNGEIIGTSENLDLEAEGLSGSLAAGTYFVGISSYDGLDTSYDLTISGGSFAESSSETDSTSDPMSV
jgi:serine protease